MRKLFLASDGRLALFWRILFAFIGTLLVYLLIDIVAILLILLGLFLTHSRIPSIYSPEYNTNPLIVSTFGIAYVLIAAATVWFLFWFRRVVDRRSRVGLAWTSLKGHGRSILLGVALGAALPLLALGIGCALGLFTLHIAHVSWWGFIIILLFNGVQYTATAIREEIYYRGYLLQNLGERVGLWFNVVCAGVIFIAAHLLNGLSYVSLSFVVVNLMLSTIWIYGRLLTRSLWFSISMHAALDCCSFLIAILLFSGTGNLSMIAASLLWLEAPFVALILLVLVVQNLRGKLHLNWRARLTESGDFVAPAASLLPEEGVVADSV